MARRILALDLGSHTLKAALIESTLRSCRVLGLFRQRRDAGRPLAEQVQEFCAAHSLRGDTVLSCLPGDAVTHRFLSLPFARPRQLDQTVPFELESQILQGLEDMVVDFQVVQRTAAGVTVLAVAAPRDTLTEHINTLAVAGLDPAAVGLAPLAPLPLLSRAGVEMSGVTALLDIGENRTSVVLLRDGVLSGLRTLSVGLSRAGGFAAFLQELRWTLLALSGDGPVLPSCFFLCGGGARIALLKEELGRALDAEILPLHQWALPPVPEEYRQEQGVFAACLGLGLREALGLAAPGINLRRGAFAHQGQREVLQREMARLGWIAAGVAVAAGLAFALETHRLNTRYEALRQEIRRVFITTLPEVQTIVNEKAQLQDAVAALQSRQRLLHGSAAAASLELLRQLSAALPEQVTLDLDEWTFDTEAVRLRGTTSSFDAAETLKTTAAGLGLFREVQLKDVKTAAGSKKVSFGLQMLLNQQEQQQ
ncbi:MAG: PilN domain-containing protein [Deltaproteobacteria bacterium]|nr:PilN domain-containing protein [Deltaproteobacteria bacterium]